MKSGSTALLLVIITFFCQNLVHGQQLLDQFYRSGVQPEELNVSASERIAKSREEYLKVYNLPEEEVEGFALRNNFYLERLNKSGEIFYENQISTYLNALKDKLLKDDYRKDFVQVYLVNYPQINAFTNDFGNIYVNVGTVAKLETEEQLLTVLAHEISHILLKHSLKSEKHVDSLQNIYSSSDFQELEVHQFSQQQELQADSMAYELLKKNGFPVVGVEELFQHLKYNANPIYTGDVDLSLLVKRTSALEALQTLYTASFDGTIPEIKVPVDDSSGTHPTIEKRLELHERMNVTEDSIVRLPKPRNEYLECKRLAEKIIVNTYMTSGMYIDGLYHTLKLLEADPTDLFLQKAKLKYLILLTQQKYRGGIEKFLINIHGNESNSRDYHTFRKFIVDLSPVDMNILANIAIEDAGISNDDYIKHLLSVSYQFLYKNNYSLFRSVDGKVEFVTDSLLQDFDRMYFIGQNSINLTDLNQLEEMKIFGYLVDFNNYQLPGFVLNYASDFNQNESRSASLQEAVKAYNQKRILYESTLTADYFPTSIDPFYMNRKERDPKFYSRVSFDSTAATAFVESLSYYLVSDHGDKQMDLAKTIKMEEDFNTASYENHLFHYDLSGTSFGEKRSIQSNYNRFSFLTWLNESFTLEDLNFSSVDEEIWLYRKTNNIDYLVFNINVVARSIEKGSRYRAFYCDMYLDIETGGISYISMIPNRLKPTKKNLKLIQYASNRQHQFYKQ